MKDNYFINIQSIPDHTSFDDLRISGEFRVANQEESIETKDSGILKHIILNVTRSGNYQSVSPFSDVVVFKDDVLIESDIVSGSFKIKLSDHIGFNGEGEYFIFCSLGTHLSDILEIKI